MSTDTPPQVAVALRFSVVVDGHDLGTFSAFEGLTAEYEVEELKEGGYNAASHRLPGRVKYANLKLTRAVDETSGSLAAWFAGVATKPSVSTGHVIAVDGWQRNVARWDLVAVWPVKYTGPQWNATGTATANEVLELAHGGFSFRKVGS